MIGQIMGAVQGVAGIASGIIGSGKRKREMKDAQAGYDRQMDDFRNLDTSNLYEDMENTYEDATVNTQTAEFVSQKQNQGMANTMAGLQGAAGGSGIASLAQAMSGQQNQAAMTAGADMAGQESAIQNATLQNANAIQSQQLAGAEQSRAAQKDKTETLLGMSQQRLGAAKAAKKAATDAIVGGVGKIAGSVIPNIPGMKQMGIDAAADPTKSGSLFGNMLNG